MLALQPGHIKALTRAGTVALYFGWQDQARDCGDFGLKQEPNNAELLNLRSKALKGSSGQQQESVNTPGRTIQSERDLHDVETEGHTDPAHLMMMRGMIQKLFQV